MEALVEPPESLTAEVVSDLRSTRQRRRLGGTQWGELAYRVYTTAFFCLVLLVMISGAIGDDQVSAGAVSDVARYGPAWAGLLLSLLILGGARSGSRGGPLALEAADVQHLLLSPANRSSTLRRPVMGLLGYGVFTGVVVMAVIGSLISQRVPGGTAEFVWSGALFGLVVSAALFGTALVACSRILPRWVPLVLGWVLVAWSVGDLLDRTPTAPTTIGGDLLFWPMRRGAPGLVWVVVVIALAVIGARMVGGLSIEDATRRTRLVGQLRFAVTQQDLRSVVLLRRQLASEVPRRRRWFPVPDFLGRHLAVTTRDLQSIAHWPLVRILRVAVLVGGAAVAARGVFAGTTPLIVVAGIAMFVAGTDAAEGLSQEVDHPTLLESYPIEPGLVLLRHLVAPSVLLVVGALVSLGVLYAIYPTTGTLGVGAVLVVTAPLAAVAGTAVSIVSQIQVESASDALMTPEVAGPRLVMRTVWPPLVAVVGFLPVLLAANVADADPAGVAALLAVPVLGLVAAVFGWVRFRDRIHESMAEAMPG
ncbi:MAG: hypothetical protein ACK5O2_14755 [Microthrixaceae bacterium]